jgi:hypothetical protein
MRGIMAIDAYRFSTHAFDSFVLVPMLACPKSGAESADGAAGH